MAAGFELYRTKDGYHFRLRDDEGVVAIGGPYPTKVKARDTVEWIKDNAYSEPIRDMTVAAAKPMARSLSRS